MRGSIGVLGFKVHAKVREIGVFFRGKKSGSKNCLGAKVCISSPAKIVQ
jgi:hypothetical protein